MSAKQAVRQRRTSSPVASITSTCDTTSESSVHNTSCIRAATRVGEKVSARVRAANWSVLSRLAALFVPVFLAPSRSIATRN